MRKVTLIICVAALLIGLVAASASAGVGNWVLTIKAFNPTFLSSQNSTDIGIQGTADAYSNQSGSPTSGKAMSCIDQGTTVYRSKWRVANTTTLPYTWNLKIGMNGSFNSVKIAIYNQAQDSFSLADQTLDTNVILTFKNGANTVATFSNLANKKAEMVNWVNINELLKGMGWTPTATDTGWVYEDTTPTSAGSWSGLEAYSMTVQTPVVPEPGSLMALGSGLVGLFGFAIRRRRA